MKLGTTEEVRTGKVAEMKSKIKAGTADLEFKLDTAVDRLLDDMLSDKMFKSAADRVYRKHAA